MLPVNGELILHCPNPGCRRWPGADRVWIDFSGYSPVLVAEGRVYLSLVIFWFQSVRNYLFCAKVHVAQSLGTAWEGLTLVRQDCLLHCSLGYVAIRVHLNL